MEAGYASRVGRAGLVMAIVPWASLLYLFVFRPG
jgi:hypothetical protein